MDNKVEIVVGAQDNSKLDLASLQEKLKRLGNTVATARARVDGDAEAEIKVERLALKLAALGRKVASPRIGLEGAARAELDIAAVGLALDHVGDKVGSPSGGGLAGKLTALGSVFKGFGTMAAGALAVGLTGPLAGAGLALGAFGAVAAPTLVNVEKALTTTGDAGKKAYAKLDPAQVGLYNNIKTLEKSFDSLAQSLEPVVTHVLGLATNIATDLLPYIAPLAKAGGQVIDDFLKPLDKLVQSPFFANFVKQMGQLATQIGPLLGQTLVNLLKVFIQLFEQAGPSAVKILQQLLPAIVQIAGNLVPVVADITEVVGAVIEWLAKNKLLIPALGLLGAAFIALGVAMDSNPIMLIVTGLALLTGALIDAWKHSQTFRDVVVTVLSVVGQAVLTFAGIWLKQWQIVVDGFFDAVHYILDGAEAVAKVIDIVMGTHLASAVQAASRNWANWKADVDNTFNAAENKVNGWKTTLANMPKVVRLHGDINDLTAKLNSAKAQLRDPNLTKTRTAQIHANIAQLQYEIEVAKAQLNGINGKVATTYIRTVAEQVTYQSATGTRGGIGGGPLRASGGITGAATGGVRGRLTMVGEHGRELIELPPGSYVHSNPDTERMVGQGGGGGGVVLEVVSGGASAFEQFMLMAIREWVRVKGGGDVQRAFGVA